MIIYLRPIDRDDLMFSLKVRNHPLLMKWFRQDEPISVEDQREFIENDIKGSGYNGNVIEVDGVDVGLCGVKKTGEFTIAILPEYQKKGISSQVMKLLVEASPSWTDEKVWSEVFVGNPALEFFISKCGFKVSGVKERAYYKQGKGLVDVVKIYHA